MPPARTTKKAPKRASKPAPRRRARRSSLASLRLPVLDQRQLDIVGLGLVAIAVFLVFPLWLGWEAGAAGEAVTDGLRRVVGEVAYAVPVVLALIGALVVLRPVLPAVRPLRAGALCLFGAVTLAWPPARSASGPTACARAGGTAPGWRSTAASSARPCCTASTKASGRVGAHILAVFLFIAGVILLTGASIAGVIRATHSGVTDTTRALRTAVPQRGPRPEPVAPAGARGRGGARHPDDGARAVARRPRSATPTSSATLPTSPTPNPSPEPEPEPEPVAEEPIEEPDAAPDDEPSPTASWRSAPRTSPRRDACAARSPTTRRSSGRRPTPQHPQALQRRAEQARHRRAGADGARARRGARPLRGAGEDHRHGRRPAHHPLRAAARARHQDEQGRPAQGRPRLRPRRDGHPHPRARSRQDGGRRRGPQPAAPDGAARRRLPGPAGGLVAADGVAGQGRRRQGDRRGPGEDAAPARRGHDRRGQVGRDQRDALEHPAARDAARGAARPRRPQAGRAQPLRVGPAPAHAGHHEPADGRQRAPEPREGDGGALLDHVARPHAVAQRAQPGARGARREGAAVHPVRHRRARRPHDGRAGRRRGLDHPPRPEGARGRHPPRAGDAVARGST